MKSGAGDDPFADDPVATDDQSDGEDDTTADDRDATGTAPPASADEPAAQASAPPESGPGDGQLARQDIPWVLRRGSVKDDRPNVTQFFLRDETDRAERRFQSDVEDRLDRDVYTLDLREAAYLVAMRHPDEVAAQLREWGYDYLD